MSMLKHACSRVPPLHTAFSILAVSCCTKKDLYGLWHHQGRSSSFYVKKSSPDINSLRSLTYRNQHQICACHSITTTSTNLESNDDDAYTVTEDAGVPLLYADDVTPDDEPKYVTKNRKPSVNKFWLVTQRKPWPFRLYWEKDILARFGLTKKGDYVVLKNTPRINATLWKVKHMVDIHPITFPNGFPTEADLGYTQIKQNREFVIVKSIDKLPSIPANPDQVVQTLRRKRMDYSTWLKTEKIVAWKNF